MGISGLLPLLKSIHKPTHLSKFAGQTLGVDAYGWLHRGTVSCAIELAQDKPTDKYVEFAMHRVRMLIHYGVKPYLVFDGDYLPSKAATERERASRRREAKKLGLDLLRLGKTTQAQLELQKAVDVTPAMARRLIEELKRAGVQYVVAPYEADSQMAYLERRGVIDGIVSEDSDLLVFGARVLLTKLDQYGGCVMLRRDDLAACAEVSLVGWSDVEFRHMAILSGCDYMDSIPGMGLKTAHRLLRRHKTVGRVVKALQFDGKYKVPAGYLDDLEKADRTFLHQWVFCPLEKRLVNLTLIPENITPEDLPFIGKYHDPQVAAGVAVGDLDPHTKEPIVIPPAARGFLSRQPSTARNKENLVQTPDLKKSKSIESFFKAARTPLAELDPNSFTPSPSQQQLLERQRSNGAWSASPAPVDRPRPYLQQPSTRGTLPTPRHSARRTMSTPLSSHAPGSHSAKRMRLCADAETATAEATQPSSDERSKFFAPQKQNKLHLDNQSPFSRRKRSRRTDFNIFSDDSVEDALAALPEPSGQPVSASTADPDSAGEADARLRDDGGIDALDVTRQHTALPESQTTVATTACIEESQVSRQTRTQATSVDLDSQRLDSQQLGTVQVEEATDAGLLPGSAQLQSGANTRGDDAHMPTITQRPRSTPSHTPTKQKAILPQDYSSIRFTDLPLTAVLPDRPDKDDSTGNAPESSVLVFDSPPAPQPYIPKHHTSGRNSRIISAAEAVTITTRALLQQGSEDMLVPSSSSDDAVSESDGDCREDLNVVPLSPVVADASTLNLSRFAFVG